jgi:sulfur-carrier protein
MSGTSVLTIELCGRLVEPIGSHITLHIPADGCTADVLLATAASQHPALAPALAATRVRVCVNDAIVTGDAWVNPGDDVALFPPVSGG